MFLCYSYLLHKTNLTLQTYLKIDGTSSQRKCEGQKKIARVFKYQRNCLYCKKRFTANSSRDRLCEVCDKKSQEAKQKELSQEESTEPSSNDTTKEVSENSNESISQQLEKRIQKIGKLQQEA